MRTRRKAALVNVEQALDYTMQPSMPLLFGGDAALQSERQRNEEALKALLDAFAASEDPGFSFDVVRKLADRNRSLCDKIGEDRLRNLNSVALNRGLSDADICQGIAALQQRPAAEVEREVRGDRDAFAIAYVSAPVRGTVIGIDIETTGTAPERGYIINMGLELMELTESAKPFAGGERFYGLPEEPYRTSGVPLTNIHGITWGDVEGKIPFRQDAEGQAALLSLMERYPIMAHNASFEDSWFRLHLDGYAEARRAGKIAVIDSRDICRKLDGEVAALPRESAPASLENWARRRGTLAVDEKERHLGLADADLMLKTVQAEFLRKNMFTPRS